MDNTIRSSDLRVPSGLEVESASLHMPAPAGQAPQAQSRSWKEKVIAFPREQYARVRPKVDDLKSNASAKLSTVSTKASQSLHDKPALWAGIAAGLGLAAGIAGRVARHRIVKRSRPTFVIIEETC